MKKASPVSECLCLSDVTVQYSTVQYSPVSVCLYLSDVHGRRESEVTGGSVLVQSCSQQGTSLGTSLARHVRQLDTNTSLGEGFKIHAR